MPDPACLRVGAAAGPPARIVSGSSTTPYSPRPTGAPSAGIPPAPPVRGSGVVAHAVARGVAIGASVHRVDGGIDTGAVLARRLLPVAPGATLTTLEAEAMSLAAALLADVVATVATVATGPPLPAGNPQSTRTALCRRMAPQRRRDVEAAVAAGEAERLFARWRAACEPEVPPWDLRPDALLPARESPPHALPDPAS